MGFSIIIAKRGQVMKHVSVRAGFFLFCFFILLFFSCGGAPAYGPHGSFSFTYGSSASPGSASARNILINTIAKSVPAVAATVGAVNMFRAAYRWMTGNSPKNRSFVGNECHCKDPDLCWVKRQKVNEIKNLYEQSLRLQGSNVFYADISQVQRAWNNLGFDKLSEDAQRFLKEKFCALENERNQQVIPLSKVEKPLPQPVETAAERRAEEIRQYGQNLVPHNDRQQKRLDAIHEALENGFRVSYKRYNLSENTYALLGEYGMDAAAFQECTGNAIQQQTHAEFVNVLNRGTDLFLSIPKIIDPVSAKASPGWLPGDIHKVDEGWMFALGHFSLLGTQGSKAGYYSLAHELSDVCQGVYDVARATLGFFQGTYELGTERLSEMAHQCCTFIKRAYQHPRGAFEDIISVLTDSAVLLTECGRWAEGFLHGVAHKAFVRPLLQFAQLSAYTRSNPEIIREIINKVLFATAKSVYKGYLLSLALDDDPESEKTEQCARDFRDGCLAPLCAGLATVAQEFEALSNKDKAEEIAALVVQWVTINGLGKLANLAAQEGQFAQLANVIKLAEEGAPVFEAGLGSGGAISVSLPVAEEVATGVAAGFEVATAAGATGVFAASRIPFPSHDGPGSKVAAGVASKSPLIEKSIALKAAKGRGCTACQNLLAQEGGCADQCCASCKHASQALQKAYDEGAPTYRMLVDKGLPVKGTKIILSKESFCLTEAQLKQLEPFFNRVVKSKGALVGKDIPEEFMLTEKFWRHIFTGELEMLMDSSGVVKPRFSGFHFDELAKNLKSKALKLVDISRDGATGAYSGYVRPRGSAKSLQKSFFPAEWSPKGVADKIIEALGNLTDIDFSGGRFVFSGITKEGIKLRLVVESNGSLVTAFPVVPS